MQEMVFTRWLLLLGWQCIALSWAQTTDEMGANEPWNIGDFVGLDYPDVLTPLDVSLTDHRDDRIVLNSNDGVLEEEMIVFLENNATLQSTPILKYILAATDSNGIKSEPAGKVSPMRPRDNHAVASYRDRLWMVGGYAQEYINDELLRTNRMSDVWSSIDGTNWELRKTPPWEARYGHSLTEFQDKLVMIGGFRPVETNEIWTMTVNDEVNTPFRPDLFATEWSRLPVPPFSPRGWHRTVVFSGKLWVIGGMPLNNEVWSTTDLTHWEMHQTPSFGPRSAFGITVQPRWIRANITDSSSRFFEYEEHKPNYKDLVLHLKGGNVSSYMNGTYTKFETLYLSGGWDGTPRNDIWATTDGEEWIELTPHATWDLRGWHSMVTFSTGTAFDIIAPRIWIFGGGYIGLGVRTMQSSAEIWWTRDGITWNAANSVDANNAAFASGKSWCTDELDLAATQQKTCGGHWGGIVIPFHSIQYRDVNLKVLDGKVTSDAEIQQIKGNAGSALASTILEQKIQHRALRVEVGRQPAMFLIGGDVGNGNPRVEKMFSSSHGMICEKDGQICNYRGVCQDGKGEGEEAAPIGCSCHPQFWGEFCEDENPDFVSGGPSKLQSSPWLLCVVFFWPVHNLLV